MPWWGVGPHPLTTPHFTAAELATSLGVDEGLLACLHLQVCVVGQALLSLFSVMGGTHVRLEILWCDAQPPHPSSPTGHHQLSKQEKGRATLLPSSLGEPRPARKAGGHLRGKGSESCRPALPMSTAPPALPYLSLHR